MYIKLYEHVKLCSLNEVKNIYTNIFSKINNNRNIKI